MQRLLIVSCMMILLSACATPSEGFIPGIRSKPQYALVYFLNPPEGNGVANAELSLDVAGISVGTLRPGEYSWRELSPSSHRVLGRLGDGEVMQYLLGLDPGGDYYVSVIPGEDGRPRLVTLNEEFAMQWLEESIPAARWGSAATRLENVRTERQGSLSAQSELPLVAREPRLIWSDIAELFNHRCSITVVFGFRLDKSGFPHDVKIENAEMFNADQTEWAKRYFKGFRFRAFRKDGVRVERSAVLPVEFNAPPGRCNA